MNVVVLRQLPGIDLSSPSRTKWQKNSSPLYKESDALYDYEYSCCTEESLNTEAQHCCRDYEECCIVITGKL